MRFFQRPFGKREAKEIADTKWQTPIVREIAMAMLNRIPEDWSSAALVLEVTDKGLGSGLAHSAITPEPTDDMALQDANFVMPDMSVMAATRKLELEWVKREGTFKRIVIWARYDGETWEIGNNYFHQ